MSSGGWITILQAVLVHSSKDVCLELCGVLRDEVALRELKDPTLHFEEAIVFAAQESAVHLLKLLPHFALTGLV
jgi:hypothetical protein